jgi:metallo-beta-lactamase family protein
VKVNAEILRMEFYSAHADRNELLRYLGCQKAGQVKKLFLVHGVERSLLALKGLVMEQGFKEVLIPRRGERFNL